MAELAPINRFCFICSIYWLLISGCADRDQKHFDQIQAQEKLKFASRAVQNGVQKSLAVFSTAQLRAMIGKPDYVVSIADYLKLYEVNREYQQVVSRDLHDDYQTGLSVVDKLRKSGVTCLPVVPNDIKSCRVWMYDESRHFSRPYQYCWHNSDGFLCVWFYVQDELVLGFGLDGLWTNNGPRLLPDDRLKLQGKVE